MYPYKFIRFTFVYIAPRIYQHNKTLLDKMDQMDFLMLGNPVLLTLVYSPENWKNTF